MNKRFGHRAAGPGGMVQIRIDAEALLGSEPLRSVQQSHDPERTAR